MFLLLASEIVARVDRGTLLRLQNHRLLRLERVRRGYPSMTDPRLGYVPIPSYSSRDNLWQKQVSIDETGFRSNGAAIRPEGRPIVAVGDSFTFGDEVNDDETWPAWLERTLERPVINGGVFGYSFGQSILRAEKILGEQSADWLVVGFIPSDITRCECAKWYAWKPYFELKDQGLALHLPPAEALPLDAGEARLKRFKNALGYSALLDSLLAHTPARSWWFMNERTIRVHPPGAGLEISRRLVNRIAAHSREEGYRLLLVAQGHTADGRATALIEHARHTGVATLDLIAEFLAEEERDPGIRNRYFQGHMTAEGNRWVANHVSRHIREAESMLQGSSTSQMPRWSARLSERFRGLRLRDRQEITSTFECPIAPHL